MVVSPRPSLKPRLRVLTKVGFRAVHCDPRLTHFVNIGTVPKAVARATLSVGFTAAFDAARLGLLWGSSITI